MGHICKQAVSPADTSAPYFLPKKIQQLNNTATGAFHRFELDLNSEPLSPTPRLIMLTFIAQLQDHDLPRPPTSHLMPLIHAIEI